MMAENRSTHTLKISGLDDFEATHISQILTGYKTRMMADKIHAFVEDHKDRWTSCGMV